MRKFYLGLFAVLFSFSANAFDMVDVAGKVSENAEAATQKVEEQKADWDTIKAEREARVKAKKAEYKQKLAERKAAREAKKAELEAQKEEQKKAVEDAKASLSGLKNALSK